MRRRARAPARGLLVARVPASDCEWIGLPADDLKRQTNHLPI
eukprot:COSAG02_NODE_26161_length_639_cov_1.111111_1_plen_42_part_00